MQTEAEKRVAIRLLRGGIVRSLYRVLTAEVDATDEYLNAVLRPKPPSILGEAMSYLTASGYVAEEVSRIDAGDPNPLTTYKLTAKGMQLAERVIEDPSVTM